MVPSILLAVLFCIACMVHFHAADCFVFVDRFVVHRLFGLLVPDVADAGACTYICLLCARDWYSNRHLGFTTSRQSEKSSILLLDLMQTMPAFVYLLPAIFFFNIGVVPGVVASVIFSMPPTIRLTMLGIEQVPKDLIEATEAFGSTTWQRLLKVQIPLAKPTIMAGVNQSIMLALIHGCYCVNGRCTRAR